jgi:hypothetical protein
MELIRVAFGVSDEREAHQTADQSHNLVLVDLTRKTVISNDIAEIVQEVTGLSPADRMVVLQYIKRLVRAQRKAQRKRRSV